MRRAYLSWVENELGFDSVNIKKDQLYMAMYADGVFADSTLFSMLTLPFLQGNASGAFTQPWERVSKKKVKNGRVDRITCGTPVLPMILSPSFLRK